MELPDELRNRPERNAGQKPSATITIDAYRRLRAELDELKGGGREHVAERLRLAREHGDIRENAEYDAAKNEQGLMEARIRQLAEMLRDPDIVQRPATAEAAGPGMVITVRPLDEEEEEPQDEVYLLADSAEERHPGARTVTITSPLGSALLGAGPDQEVVYEAPGGSFRYRVVALEPHAG
jgi:transcription elongation factor GreA